MGDLSLNELHELPLANRVVDDIVRDWLDRHFGTAYSTVSEDGAEMKVLEQARHMHLDGYTYDLTPRILDALKRAGLLRA